MRKKYSIQVLNQLMSDESDSEVNFIPILADDSTPEVNSSDIPDVIPILALRNTTLFPGVVMPITVGREKSINLIKSLPSKKKIIGVTR